MLWNYLIIFESKITTPQKNQMIVLIHLVIEDHPLNLELVIRLLKQMLRNLITCLLYLQW